MSISDHIHLILPEESHPQVDSYFFQRFCGSSSLGCVAPGTKISFFAVVLFCFLFTACRCDSQLHQMQLITPTTFYAFFLVSW